MRVEVMYIERKTGLDSDGLHGPARIGRATWTKSRRGLRYRGLLLLSLNGRGYKSNYIDAETDDEFWVSRPRKDGRDRLYSGAVEIDDDAREEYWTVLRRRPDLVEQTGFYSAGKYAR